MIKLGKVKIMKPLPTLTSWHHGDRRNPRDWPAWKLFHFAYNSLPTVHPPSSGHRFWLYTLFRAYAVDVYIDRRSSPEKPQP